MFEESAGLRMPCCMRLYLKLPGEGLPHKMVANTLAGHMAESKTVYRLRLKNSLCCCTLAEYFAVDEKLTTALSISVSFQKVVEV